METQKARRPAEQGSEAAAPQGGEDVPPSLKDDPEEHAGCVPG